MKKVVPILLFVSLGTGSLIAQEPEVPPKHLRFIPLGELPPWKDQLQNGIRVGNPPPKGALPPQDASIVSGDTGFPLNLTLRSLTPMVTIDGATPQLLLKKGKLGAAQNWLASKMPTAKFSLGVLYRDPAAMNWNEPRMLLLNDAPTAFPAGTARFVNVSDRLVLVQIGDPNLRPVPPVFGVPAGKSILKPLKTGSNPIRAGYLSPDKRRVWIWTNKVNLLQNQRLQAFFYKAQDPNPRQPVKFHFVPEPTPN